MKPVSAHKESLFADIALLILSIVAASYITARWRLDAWWEFGLIAALAYVLIHAVYWALAGYAGWRKPTPFGLIDVLLLILFPW